MWKLYFDHHQIDESKIRQAAERAGQTVEGFVAEAVRQRLTETENQTSDDQDFDSEPSAPARYQDRLPESKL